MVNYLLTMLHNLILSSRLYAKGAHLAISFAMSLQKKKKNQNIHSENINSIKDLKNINLLKQLFIGLYLHICLYMYRHTYIYIYICCIYIYKTDRYTIKIMYSIKCLYENHLSKPVLVQNHFII